MKKTSKRILSLLMALSLVMSLFASAAFADGDARAELNIGEYDEEWVAVDLIQGDTFYDLQMMIAEPLFLYNHETGELESCLAEAPTFSEDGTVMTFVVPEGRKFATGADLDAGDVVASLQHGIDDGAMSDTFAVITNLSYEGNTVTVEMESYSTALLIMLVSPFFCVIDSEQLDTMTNEELLWGAVPYGAYYVSDYTPGAGCTLKVNEGFQTLNNTVENKGASYIPTINVNWYQDEFAMIAAYQAGELDLLINVTEDAVAVVGNNPGTVVSSSLPPMVRNIQMNANHEFFSDARVREAVALLIDREQIVAAFGGDTMCTAQYEFITENVMYHTPDVETWYMENYANNAEKAMELLAEAGWTDSDGDGILDKDGEKMPTLTFNTASGKNETAALTIQMMLQSYGFDINVVTTSEANALAAAGEYDINMTNYWWSEPANFLIGILKDHNDFDETEYREMVAEIKSTTDNAYRFELVEQAQKYLMEQMVIVPLYTTSYVKIYDESLSDIHFIVDGMFLNDIK